MKFLTTLILAGCSNIAFGQLPLQTVPEVARTGDTVTMDWESAVGLTYFVQYSFDLIEWNYLPVIAAGTGSPLGYGMQISSDKMFVRLHYTNIPASDVFGADMDGDNISNWDEVREGGTGTSPLIADTNGDGIRDDGLVYAAQNDPDGAGLSANIQNGMIGRWDFEPQALVPTPANYTDKTGNGNHAVTSIGVSTDGMDAIISKSCKMPGIGHLNLPPEMLNGVQQFTLSTWINPTEGSMTGAQSGTARVIFSYASSQTALPSLILYLKNETQVILGNYINGVLTDIGSWTAPEKLDDGQWRHLCLSRDGSGPSGTTYKLYLNGQQIGNGWGGTGATFGNYPNGYFMIGRSQPTGGTGQYDGLIDRLILHDRGLSQAEALELYQNDIDGDGLWDITEHRSLMWRDTNGNEVRELTETGYFISPYYYDDASSDHDGDGRTSLVEQNDTQNPTNLFDPDSDGDGITDGWEVVNGLDPNDPDDADDDDDSDGANNLVEFIHNSDPNDSDSDDDTVSDGTEINGPDGNHETAGGSNPNDASDGGQPLPPDEKLSIIIGVGDKSGSFSEDYVMNIFRINPETGAEERFYTLRSGGYGQYKEITQDIFRKSDTYTFQIDWQSSSLGTAPIGTEGPDFDYNFKVEPQNDSEGLLVDSYNPETGEPDRGSPILGVKNNVTTFRETVEKMRVLRTRVDLDVDSDNTTYIGYPAEGDRSAAEDAIEDSADEVNYPGARTHGNNIDFDTDGVPGYADGIDKFGNEGSGACDEFEPMIVDLGLIHLFPYADIEFVYAASDPDDLTKTPEGYYIRPSGGILRIWKKDGSESRKSAAIDGGGDFIATNTAYSIQDLGTPNAGGLYTFYAEAVDQLALMNSHRITMKVYPFGKPNGTMREDAVKIDIYRIPNDNHEPPEIP